LNLDYVSVDIPTTAIDTMWT